MRLVAQGVAGGGRLETDRGGDIAREYLVDVLTPDGVHAQDSPDALAAPGRWIHHR